MKYLALIIFGAGLVAGAALYLNHVTSTSEDVFEIPSALAIAQQPCESPERAPRLEKRPQAIKAQASGEPKSEAAAASASMKLDLGSVGQVVDTLTSPGVSYIQKQATWKQLKENGALDQVVRELEQRAAGNPTNAASAAVLGHAYLQKCSIVSDLREQGILAMQADKLFDTALSLDPANWEARFTKAVSLTFWPPYLGKSEEILQHFTTLIQQQETQSPQPEFADTYLWLGDQYQKAGRSEDARSVWERGAMFFPENERLRGRLTTVR